MFKNRRHIHARRDEWIHVHRNNRQQNNLDLPKIVGMGAGLFILAVLVWELIKATYPFLIILGVIATVIHSKRRNYP